MTSATYAWYCGRFLGICQMLREPKLYRDQQAIIEQLLVIEQDYQRERAREECA